MATWNQIQRERQASAIRLAQQAAAEARADALAAELAAAQPKPQPQPTTHRGQSDHQAYLRRLQQHEAEQAARSKSYAENAGGEQEVPN
jgi:hypothetical protein